MFKLMGTGSRSMVTRHDRADIYRNLESKILFMNDAQPLHLISGMAEGWDEAIAKVGMRHEIPYTVYLPSPSYGEYYWGGHSLTGNNRMHTFNMLCENAAEVIVVCKDHGYGKANFTRNQAMVDACDGALVFNATSRGTRDAVDRLAKAEKPFETYPFSTPKEADHDC